MKPNIFHNFKNGKKTYCCCTQMAVFKKNCHFFLSNCKDGAKNRRYSEEAETNIERKEIRNLIMFRSFI